MKITSAHLHHVFLATFICFYHLATTAQNLIPDPGFEEYTTNPNYQKNWEKYHSEHWYMGTRVNRTTQNAFHFDLYRNGIDDHFLEKPNYKPRNGIGIAIIRTTFSGIIGSSINTNLKQKLQKDSIYKITFHVKLTDVSNLCIDRFQIDFSQDRDSLIQWNEHDIKEFQNIDFIYPEYEVKTKYGDYNTVFLEKRCYLCNKDDWTQVSGFYMAEGGEQCVRIGVFHHDFSIIKTNKGFDKLNCEKHDDLYNEMLNKFEDFKYYKDYKADYLIDDVSIKKVPNSKHFFKLIKVFLGINFN